MDLYLNDRFVQKYIVDDDEYPITVENLALGKNTIKFVYGGNQFYNPATKELTVTYAHRKPLFLEIAAQKYDIKVEEQVQLIFNASSLDGPVDDINISLYINDVYKGDFNVKVLLSFYALGEGSYNIKAVFAGNENYTPKTMEEINENLEEEYTDVQLSANACGLIVNWNTEHKKAIRWIERNE